MTSSPSPQENNAQIPVKLESLVEKARSDPEAFKALYTHFLPRVYRYLYHHTGNIHDAEDITAQVFMEAMEGLVRYSFHRSGSFTAWLFTIARRRLIDYYRKKSPVPLTEQLAAHSDLLKSLEQKEDFARLAHLLSQLDEDRRELLSLRFSAGLTFAEISLIDGRSEAAVKMSIYRILDDLRARWEDENE